MRHQDMPWRVLRHVIGQFLLVAMLVGGAGSGTVVSAQGLPGSDDPEFVSAFERWLADDEMHAVPELAQLAQDDNTAAQILLGLIDKTSALQGPWVTSLSRQDRISALRASGGLSGQNWMTVAAPDSAYAQLWAGVWQLQGGVEIAQEFAATGDTRAVQETLLVLASRQQSGFPRDVVSKDWFPAALSYLAADWPASFDETRANDPGDPQQRMRGQHVADEDLQRWLDQSDLAAPLRQVCDAQCPASASQCGLALYKGLGSYPALMMLGSPVSALIPSEGFYRSARGRASLARRIMLTRSARMREADLARLTETNACAADWLRKEYGRYAYSLPSVPLTPQ